MPCSIKTFENLDIAFLFLKSLSKTHKMINNMREYFLYFRDYLSLLHSEHFILLNESMLPCYLHIVCPFISDFKDVPHLLCRCTLWYLEKIIRTQCRYYYTFRNPDKFSFLAIWLSPFTPRFFNTHIIFFCFWKKMTIFNSIQIPLSVDSTKKNHYNLPELIVYNTK